MAADPSNTVVTYCKDQTLTPPQNSEIVPFTITDQQIQFQLIHTIYQHGVQAVIGLNP